MNTCICCHKLLFINHCFFYLQVGNFMQFIRIIVIDELQICNKYENYHLHAFPHILKSQFFVKTQKLEFSLVYESIFAQSYRHMFRSIAL